MYNIVYIYIKYIYNIYIYIHIYTSISSVPMMVLSPWDQERLGQFFGCLVPRRLSAGVSCAWDGVNSILRSASQVVGEL